MIFFLSLILLVLSNLVFLAFCGFVGEKGSITSNFLFQLIYGCILCRRGQPTIEFIFAATEEAIFVHVIISAK